MKASLRYPTLNYFEQNDAYIKMLSILDVNTYVYITCISVFSGIRQFKHWKQFVSLRRACDPVYCARSRGSVLKLIVPRSIESSGTFKLVG